MKKLLGLLAFMLATVSFAQGEQDVVKSIRINSDWRQGYTDKSGNDANEIGNEGFKKANKTKLRWRNEFGTTLGLNDEFGLDADLFYKHDEDRFYNNGKRTKSKKGTDLIDANLSKSLQLGSLDTTTKLGVRHWTKLDNFGDGSKHTSGESNEYYFGPTFGVNVLGQNIKTTAQAVYFNQRGTGNQDNRYYRSGDDNAKEGWGVNLTLGTDGDILQSQLGNIDYYVTLENYLRDARGKNNKSNVKLDYTTGFNYKTPSFAGFYGFINPENEWSRHTATTGWENEFSLWTGVGYKTGIETGVGTITINPRVAYRPVHKDTVKIDEHKTTTETNELRAGLKVSLDVK